MTNSKVFAHRTEMLHVPLKWVVLIHIVCIFLSQFFREGPQMHKVVGGYDPPQSGEQKYRVGGVKREKERTKEIIQK